MRRLPLWFSVVRLILLLAILIEYLFWYTPSMRKLNRYEAERERAFNAAQDCWQREYYTFKNYGTAGRCFDSYSLWEERNDQPGSGFDWPWAGWKPVVK